MINQLTFSVEINADRKVIWEALWGDSAYREWAGVFYEGSYVVAENWDEGSVVHFLIPDQSGIYSKIEKHIPHHIIEFKHIGTVLGGVEQPIDEETQKWSGATERYSISEEGDTKTLNINIDVLDEHLEFMTDTFPKTLEKLKSNCV